MLGWFQRIEQRLGSIETEVRANRKGLDEHMKRTDLLEKKMESVPQRLLTHISILSGLLILAKTILSVL